MKNAPILRRIPVRLVLGLAAIALLLCSMGTPLALIAAPQGKGGTIKPLPTPAPTASKTTSSKKNTTPARASRTNAPKNGNSADAVELAFWNSIKESTDPEDFRAYLKKYPNGQFVDLANNRIRTLEAAKANPVATEQPKSTSTTTSDAKAGQPAVVTPPAETKADAPNHFEKAKALANSDREAAEAEYRSAIRLDPGNAEYHNYLSLNLSSQCKNSEAETEYREAVRLGPTYDRYMGLARLLMANEKYEESLAAMKEAAALIKPGYAPWHREFGGTLAKAGRWVEADAEFKEAIRLGEDPAEEHISYARTLADSRKYPEAKIELKEALRLAKRENVWRAHDRLGDILGYEKKWAEAEVEKREALRTYSSGTNALTWYELAKTLEGQGKLPEADGVFHEGMRQFPTELGIRQYYGDWLVKQKRFVEAEAQYREVIRLTSYQSPYLYAKLADALKGQNKIAEADTEYRKALHIDAYNLTARYGLPGFFEQQNKLKEAEAEYLNLIKAYCSWGSAHSDFGDFLSRQKRWKEAEAQYREAVRLNPGNTDYPEKLQTTINAQKK